MKKRLSFNRNYNEFLFMKIILYHRRKLVSRLANHRKRSNNLHWYLMVVTSYGVTDVKWSRVTKEEEKISE